MKKYSMIFGLILLAVYSGLAQSSLAPETPTEAGPQLSWEATTHDFGDIQQGDKVEYTYKFSNTGAEPLIITNVNVTCGCTTPKGWPRDPIPPGGKGEITVGFNSAGKLGRQNKVITVVSNANNENNHVSFTTNVLEKKVPQ
jgi:hypothetical protein